MFANASMIVHNKSSRRRSSADRSVNKKYSRPTTPQSPTTAKWNDHATIDLPTPPPSPNISSQKPSTSSPNTIDKNHRILSAKRDGNLKLVMQEFAALKKQGLGLTNHTYNLVLDAHATLRREGTPLTNMLKVYDEMLQLSVSPNKHTYTILLRTLCRRDVEVQKTVAMLRRQNARIGAQANDDMAALEAEANIVKAMNIFRQALQDKHVEELEVEIFNQLLRVLSHYGNTLDSLCVYQQLELSPSTAPNSATFAALINLFGRAGDIQSALGYFKKYSDLKDAMGPHDASYVYNALVDCHLKCGQLDGALRVLEEDMVTDGIKLTIIPYNSVIRHYCAQGEMGKARLLIERLLEDDQLPQPDASSYGPILSAYCQSKEFAPAQEMYSKLVKTDIAKAYGNLANFALLCLANGQRDKALTVVSDMRTAGLEPDARLSERIIRSFSQAGEVSQAIEALKAILRSMSSRSMAKGADLLVDLAHKLLKNADFSQTISVVRAMAPLCISIPSTLAAALIDSYLLAQDTEALTGSDYNTIGEAALGCHTTTGGDQSRFGAVVFRLLQDMRQAAVLPSANLTVRILTHLQHQSESEVEAEWKKTLELVQDGVHETAGATSPRSLTTESEMASNEVMKAVMRGHADMATQILEEQIIHRGLIPHPEALRDAIALAGKQGHLEAAVTMYSLCIGAYKNLEPQTRQDRAVYMATNSVLIGYAQQGDMVQAKKYYDEIKKMGQYPDGNGYASLLLGSAKCTTDEAMDALIIYDEAKRHSVKPTTFFYNVIISKLAKARKLDSALYLFEEMRQFKIPPNSITYGAIISACVRAGSEGHARRLFSEMLSSPSYQPRVGPFNNMMQFYVRQQPDRERVLEYFSELRRRHIRPSPHTYKLLMEAYASMAPFNMPTAHRMLSEMERRDRIRPQATHYATLIYAYGTLQRDVQSAERVFEEMNKANIKPDEAVYQAILDTYISNDDHLGRAEELYQQMLKRIDRSGSPYIENLFIRGYGQKGQVKQARKMFDAMSDDKLCKDAIVREPSTYEAMVRAYLDNNMVSEAKEVLDLMVRREFPEKVVATVADLL
ncbi:hypothetical protein EC973_007951 [Apophysomyces ossiformis]|uniref:Pentacotripeptide-repeat region of PRORP domain-containing protein n=1 Tax=Apophysomyces ossiformis TaxID=679940 RepID=A0A8H7EQ53_9FUNG|nr:hypothetical protein EC973_007951 [Apophysomyces ossiformis]